MTLTKGLLLLTHQMEECYFYSYYKKLIKSLWESYDKLKREQETEYKKIINFSYNNIPYYHRLFRDLKLSPENIRNIKDLEKLPLLTKKIIKRNWNEFVSVNLKNMSYYNLTTSESAESPLKFRFSHQCDRFFGSMVLYCRWGYGGYEYEITK